MAAVENKPYTFSINDLDDKRPNTHMIKNRCLHLDLESVKDNPEFQFVKQVLDKSGFLKNALLGEWYSSYQPIDPLLFEEVETSLLQNKLLEDLDSMKDEEVVQKIINDHHLLLFDLINEALLEIHGKTYTYCPHALTYRSKVSPMPVGCRVLEQVWDVVNMYLSWKPEFQPSLDDIVSRDLAKGSGWMNLQADAEFVGIELEELLMDDLLDELVFDDLLLM
ncbi:protein TRM32-like [Bidens hawaiensis]|uniref:protein TRM32-like n=1 Tax=Bidens hawaiensis TaxID=980011 RepID=UPI00404B572B